MNLAKISLSLSTPRGGSSGPATIAAPFASVNGGASTPYESWSVEYESQPTISANVAFTVSRQGYTAAAATTTYLDTMYVTKAVRQPYPNQASQSATTAALSDYIYSTDTPSGSVTNNSTFTSPKPVANWVMPHRKTVGNTVDLEIVAGHRDARGNREVAAVEFRATDGTTTVTQVVSTTTVSGRALDRHPVIVFACALDISTLTDNGLITVNAKVYPWIGAAASVLDSADQSAAREFSPRYFLKNTTLAASPPYVYLSTTGNDTTGVVSTTAATAEASPCLTIVGAINKLNTYGKVDGAIIRLGAGTFACGDQVASKKQEIGSLTITRDPNVARASAILSFGAAGWRPRLLTNLVAPLTTGCIRLTDLTILRTGTARITGEAANRLEVQFEDVDIDNASYAQNFHTDSDGYYYGATFTNYATNIFSPSSTFENRIIRGVSGDFLTGQFDSWLLLGSSLTNPGAIGPGTRAASGSIIAFNYFRTPQSSSVMIDIANSIDVTGFAVLQNVFEYTSATAATQFKVSGDSPATGNTSHVIFHNNTMAGFFGNGRSNLFYNESVAARTHKLMSDRGNIHVQINTKHDVFKTDGTRVGGWAYMYGVGSQGVFSQFIDANSGGIGTSFAQAYQGLGANIGTSASVRNDPLFTDYQGTTSGPTGGAGGGDYSVSSSSPAKGIVTSPMLSHDFAGTARPSTLDTAGAYVAP